VIYISFASWTKESTPEDFLGDELKILVDGTQTNLKTYLNGEKLQIEQILKRLLPELKQKT